MRSYYSHGKLLISGEYLVLHGALALAIPVKFGQKMDVEESDGKSELQWISRDKDGNIWADITCSKNDFSTIKNNADQSTLDTVLRILHATKKMNPAFLQNNTTAISHYLEFDRNWGLGSSATLVNNIAQFANIDPFQLNDTLWNGSGYDIACAQSDSAIFYRLDEAGRIFDTVNFDPPEKEQIFFIHLGNKQDTKNEVEKYKLNFDNNDGRKKFKEEIEIISEISEALLFCDEFADFMQLLHEHEELMQYILQEERVQTTRFGDFQGVVKSLGAWGGDFVMAASEMDPADIRAYFQKNGFNTILHYSDMAFKS